MYWLKRLTVAAMLAALAACTATDTSRSTGEQVDDAALLSRVKAALIADDATDGMDIDVAVFRGRVQLNGTAESQTKKDAATRVAEDVEGVQTVQNNLRVSEQSRRTGQYIDDNVLKTRVNTALARADDVSAIAIEVQVDRGDVALGGFVGSDAERRRAEDIAEGVEGVQSVTNDIDVRSR